MRAEKLPKIFGSPSMQAPETRCFEFGVGA